MRIYTDENNRITGWDSLDDDGIQVPLYRFEYGLHDYVYENGQIVYSPDIEQRLVEAKQQKLIAVNTLAQQIVFKVARADEVPEFERDTWPMQGAEARAWKLDPNAPTPTIDGIAADRQCDVNELREKAYRKTVFFEGVTRKVAGQRQKYVDVINAATDLDQLSFEVKYEI